MSKFTSFRFFLYTNALVDIGKYTLFLTSFPPQIKLSALKIYFGFFHSFERIGNLMVTRVIKPIFIPYFSQTFKMRYTRGCRNVCA